MFTKGEEKRAAILQKALQMFNRDGIEYVGVREIAAELQMRASNITYYFPTKEDMILALATELRLLNERTLVSTDAVDSLATLLKRFEQVMKNHIKYLCLPLSMPLLIDQLPKLRKHRLQTQRSRQKELSEIIDSMIAAGELRDLSNAEREYLIGSCSLISRGWIADCIISGREPKRCIPHYLGLISGHFQPYLTKVRPRRKRRATPSA